MLKTLSLSILIKHSEAKLSPIKFNAEDWLLNSEYLGMNKPFQIFVWGIYLSE